MEVNQKIEIAQPSALVWAFLCDVEAVAECVPGLELVDQREDGTYLASFAVKVGPMSAKLNGEGTMIRDQESRSATLEGKGIDKRGGSRARGTLRCQVADDEDGSVIAIDADFTLSGPLAQVGRTSIIDDVAQTLTRQFAENMEKRLVAMESADPGESEKSRGDQFDAGRAVSGAIKRRVVTRFKRPFGSK